MTPTPPPVGSLVTLTPTCNRERRLVALYGSEWTVRETSSKGLSALLVPHPPRPVSPWLWASIAKCAARGLPMEGKRKDPL